MVKCIEFNTLFPPLYLHGAFDRVAGFILKP